MGVSAAGLSPSLTQLPQQVDEDEAGGQQPATAPRGRDVVALLRPLEPHPHPVLQEGADQTQARQVGEILLGETQKLQQKRRKRCRQGVHVSSQ